MPQEKVKELIEKNWPKTKIELEKAMESAKKMISKGEEYIKDLSEKSVDATKKISCNLKKEKLFYDLGKLVSATSKSKWESNKKISAMLLEIRAIDKKNKTVSKKV